jgi:hypothetical protein
VEGFVRYCSSYVIRPVTLAQRAVSVHDSPSEHSPVVRILRHMDEFTVAGPALDRHNWIEVRFIDGEIGYIHDYACFRELGDATPSRSQLKFEQRSTAAQRAALLSCGALALLPGMAGLFLVALGLFLYGYAGTSGHSVTMADLPIALRGAAIGTIALTGFSYYFYKRDIDIPSLPLWWLWTGYVPALLHEILLVPGWRCVEAGCSHRTAAYGSALRAGTRRATLSWIILLAVAGTAFYIVSLVRHGGT